MGLSSAHDGQTHLTCPNQPARPSLPSPEVRWLTLGRLRRLPKPAGCAAGPLSGRRARPLDGRRGARRRRAQAGLRLHMCPCGAGSAAPTVTWAGKATTLPAQYPPEAGAEARRVADWAGITHVRRAGQSQIWGGLWRAHTARLRVLRRGRAGLASAMLAVLGGAMPPRPGRRLGHNLELRAHGACSRWDGCGPCRPRGWRRTKAHGILSKHAMTLLYRPFPSAVARIPAAQSGLSRRRHRHNLLTFTSTIEAVCDRSYPLGAMAATVGQSSAPAAAFRGQLSELCSSRRIGLFSRQGHVWGRG